MSDRQKAVVLLSGGLDSATVLALAVRQGFAAYALTIDYGQRHRFELDAARRLAESLRATRHLVLSIDLRAIGGSALTDSIDVPKRRPRECPAAGIPVTYVPARNTVFLSLALAWCEALRAEDILIGVNAVDFSGYPDCRPAFIESFERLAGLATKAGVEGTAHYRIHAPLLRWNKAQIIRAGHEAGVDFSLTHSCYDPAEDGAACGSCDACSLRSRGFREAGLPDPTRYVAQSAGGDHGADPPS